MKVLHLSKFYPPELGGIESVVYDLVESSNSLGVKADVLCFSKNVTRIVEERDNGYLVIRAPVLLDVSSAPISFSYAYSLFNIASRYDVLHIHLPNPMAALSVFFMSALLTKKIVLHWHSDIVKQKTLLKFYLPLQNWLLNRADLIIGTSLPYIQSSKQLSKYVDKCYSVPIGIKPGRFIKLFDADNPIRNKFKNRKIVFSLGRLVYYKGFEYLVQSAVRLDSEYLVIIGGTGPLYQKLKNMIDELDLHQKVILLGRVDDEDLGMYYNACDVFCLPSIEKSEAFGVVQIEAMSLGKPIVATNIEGSGTSWVNKNGYSGINVEIKNPDMLADAIQCICACPNEYLKYSAQAMSHFNDNFTRDKMVNEIVRLYHSIYSKV